MDKYDVIIIGGGIIGSSIAYFLSAQKDFVGSIAVVEPDPSYKNSSTGLSVGGIRQQFSTPLNIHMSQFAVEFLSEIDESLHVEGYNPEVKFTQNGYLSLATNNGLENLLKNYAAQKELKTDGRLMYQDELGTAFPFLHTDDLAAGVHGQTGEGWIDPFSLLKRFTNKARANGVHFLRNKVFNLNTKGNKITGVVLADGGTIEGDIFVNAAGPAAGEISRMAGIEDFPVKPRKRFVYVFRSHISLPQCPMVFDPSGVYFRPEGKQFLCGVSPPAEEDPDTNDFDIDNQLFDEHIWPVLAHRVPEFEAIRRERTWAGHYAYNVIDQNAILGPHSDIHNLIFANGFSGHGLQQAPAVGRGISELITFGKYISLDLNDFSITRFERGKLITELMVV